MQSLAISDDDTKMVTLGGQDDNNVLVWCITTKTALFSQAVGKDQPKSALIFMTKCFHFRYREKWSRLYCYFSNKQLQYLSVWRKGEKEEQIYV